MAEEKIDRLEPDQIKNTGFSKDTDKKTKRQTTAWDKYLQNTHVIKNCAGHQHFCSSQVQIFWTSQVLLCLLYDHGGGLCKYFTWDIWCDVMPVEETGRNRRRKYFFLPVSQSPCRVQGLLHWAPTGCVFLCCLAPAEAPSPAPSSGSSGQLAVPSC